MKKRPAKGGGKFADTKPRKRKEPSGAQRSRALDGFRRDRIQREITAPATKRDGVVKRARRAANKRARVARRAQR